ncbi:MAG: ankyrin repeat domain-containing protein [Acidobacteriia bacterium]|nr:ankyrin repeat domain-containing protein [Terriglobia bacterium]
MADRYFADRHFPVRPNLEQLKHQAKDLLRDIKRGEPSALAELQKHHPKPPNPDAAKLADAQLTLAHSYGLPSWPRLVLACRMTDAIWRGDVEAVRELVLQDPKLLHEDARGLPSNWGPPMSYAANIGQGKIIQMLRGLGATDLQHAFDRACLQGRLESARQLYAMGARPEANAVMGPCETLNVAGLSFLLELGAPLSDEHGNRLAPVALLLQTYSRYPKGKRECLELVAKHGIELPDTPPMALHRGRLDLLEEHLKRDPQLLSRTFSHKEIFPPELGCHADETLALHGTPLAGATLLHMCVDYDEIEIARWMIEHGANVDAKAEIDPDGFGGHTPLFGCVVSQSYRCGRQQDGDFTRLLLHHRSDPNTRASLRKRLRFVKDEQMKEYRDVTPLTWGERFQEQEWVNRKAMQLIAESGGHV